MPIPTPSSSNKHGKKEFIAYCMADETMNKEFKDNAQRFAVCSRQWDSAKKEAHGSVVIGDDEVLVDFPEINAIKLNTEERNKVPKEDFVIHDEDGDKFPITRSRSSISDAIHSWGRYKGPTSFETFKKNLIRIAKRKGWESYLPKEWDVKAAVASQVDYLDPELHDKISKEADDKFKKSSYVKNLWILKEYRKRGGKVKYSGDQPDGGAIKKQVKGSQINYILSLTPEANDLEEDLDLFESFEVAGVECSDNDFLFAAEDDKIDEVYKKYHDLVNMSYSELKTWSENPCSRGASLSRGPINRNLNLLSKSKEDWTAADMRSANRTISFISRMRGAEQGEKIKLKDGTVCPSKRDISLKNWAYNP